MGFFKRAGRADNCCAECQAAPCDPCGCCLYVWPGESGSEVYPPEDLPDTVKVNGADIYTHVGGTYYFEATIGGHLYRIRPGLVADGVGRDGYWVQETPGGLAGAGLCLIDSTVIGGIEDQFAVTYFVDLGGGVNGTVTRTGGDTCQWIGFANDVPPTTIVLDYGMTNPYAFTVAGTGGTAPYAATIKDSDNSAPDAGTGDYGTYNVS